MHRAQMARLIYPLRKALRLDAMHDPAQAEGLRNKWREGFAV